MLQANKAVIGLRELILSGALKPGARIPEVALVERLRVSRTPIRAALARLAEEGYVEKVSGGSYAVRELSERDICDAIEMRGVVEGTAARLAAERGASPLAVSRARQVLSQIDATVAPGSRTPVDVHRYLELNAAFHAHVSALAESFVVERTCQRVAALPFASPNAFVTAQTELDDVWRVFIVAHDQHRNLLDAIEARQGTRAEAIAREHARVSLVTLQSVLRTRTGMERVAGIHLVLLAGGA